MLAESASDIQLGRFSETIQLPASARYGVLEFIEQELPRWRDDSERPKAEAEDRLTEYLCEYLNSAAYKSADWNHVQFRTETGDEQSSARTIDLAVKPLACALLIENRRHNIFETILPIECKRLPTPKGGGRDEREYVFTAAGTTGGIQRFKAGLHGASHGLAGMIGYIQDESVDFWARRISEWIEGLVKDGQPGWSRDDLLRLERQNASLRTASLSSTHERSGDLSQIALRHVWVGMTKN